MHLRAQMPAARIAARGLMELRIARKVAALSGISGPPEGSDDAGLGRAWMSEYRLLTTTELMLGGPVTEPSGAQADADAGVFVRDGRRFSHVDGQHVDVMPIPNVALRDYGPDTMAALVLTGVNKVLEPVTAAVMAALADFRIADIVAAQRVCRWQAHRAHRAAPPHRDPALPPLPVDHLVEWVPVRALDRREGSVGGETERDEVGAESVLGKAEEGTGEILVSDGGVPGSDS